MAGQTINREDCCINSIHSETAVIEAVVTIATLDTIRVDTGCTKDNKNKSDTDKTITNNSATMTVTTVPHKLRL